MLPEHGLLMVPQTSAAVTDCPIGKLNFSPWCYELLLLDTGHDIYCIGKVFIPRLDIVLIISPVYEVICHTVVAPWKAVPTYFSCPLAPPLGQTSDKF